MDKKPLIIISIYAVILLVLGSLSNVVGYQTVTTSQQNLIKGRINQRELLFQTVVDIFNNKEIQRIILKSQMSRGIFPPSDIPVVTKNQLKMMYFLGLILSKVISSSRMQSMIQKNQLINPEMQKELSTVIDKDAILKKEITQLKDSECECENRNSINWNFPIICTILNSTILAIRYSYEFFIMYIYSWFTEHNRPLIAEIVHSLILLIALILTPVAFLADFLGCIEIPWPYDLL